MRYKRFFLVILLLFFVGLIQLLAQEAIPASGGEASGSGGSASYSVGQVVYTTSTGTNGSVAQGVQQPYEISVVSGLEKFNINLNVSTYPNPTTDFLLLKVEYEDLKKLSYQLYDTNGKLLESKKLIGDETNIDMSNLLAATYFLKVTQKNKELKTFKIIKY